MKKVRVREAILLIILLFLVVPGISIYVHFPYLAKAVSGELSAGTWMSGTLLVISASISLCHGLRCGWYPWLIISAFFFILAIDERFMLHEQIKERLIFKWHMESFGIVVYEIPVIAGAFVGIAISFLLWRHLQQSLRVWLVTAIVLGTGSVIFDIFRVGVLVEDLFKLFAELIITCTLLAQFACVSVQKSN